MQNTNNEIHAYQVAPENQESPLDSFLLNEEVEELGLIMFGNRNYNEHCAERLTDIFEAFKDSLTVEETIYMLEQKTGEKYNFTTIKGDCQSDWQNMFYPLTMDLPLFEAEYFNTGTEWKLVYEDGEEFFAYICDGYNKETYAKAIYDYTGEIVKPENVHEFIGYTKTPIWD